ncbi:hypothetical protein [Phreatobacter sp.]|uniref:hypothetical protein n=1 Tax=Phreatobacter sp. TaxID=1966341 RepID=UPI003F70CB12
MDLIAKAAVWLAVAAATGWLLSFWPRWVAAEVGIAPATFLKRPWMRGWHPYRERLPVISLRFWRFLFRRGLVLEFLIAAIVFWTVLRAASAFLRAAAAVPA